MWQALLATAAHCAVAKIKCVALALSAEFSVSITGARHQDRTAWSLPCLFQPNSVPRFSWFFFNMILQNGAFYFSISSNKDCCRRIDWSLVCLPLFSPNFSPLWPEMWDEPSEVLSQGHSLLRSCQHPSAPWRLVGESSSYHVIQTLFPFFTVPSAEGEVNLASQSGHTILFGPWKSVVFFIFSLSPEKWFA